MNRQIDEMANDIAKICPDLDCFGQVNCITHIASSLSKMGYRKAEDIYEDIYEGRIEIVKIGDNDKRKKASDVTMEIFNWLEAHFVNLNFVSGNVELNFGDYLRFKTNILMEYTEGEG